MRVFVGTKEISNWVHLYAGAFKDAGHEVITCAEPHPFYPSNYTHNLHSPRWLFQPIKNPRYRFFESLRFRFADLFKTVRKFFLLVRYSWNTELFVFIGDGFFRDSTFDFWFLKLSKKKVIQIFYGGDVRDWEAFNQKYPIDIDVVEPNLYNEEQFNEKVFRLRKAELYADALFSVEDQGVLALRPFHKLLIPFQTDKGSFQVNNRELPRVVHIESRQPYKGEKYIYAAIEVLRQEGVRFQFQAFRGISHHEVMEVLRDADILVDEVMIFGPGTLGHEAIASGCALATKMQHDHFLVDCVCALDYTDIVEPLRAYILDRPRRMKDVQDGFERISRITNSANVANYLLSRLSEDPFNAAKHDYVPRFIIDSYKPPLQHRLNRRNKRMTRLVAKKFNLSASESVKLREKGHF